MENVGDYTSPMDPMGRWTCGYSRGVAAWGMVWLKQWKFLDMQREGHKKKHVGYWNIQTLGWFM